MIYYTSPSMPIGKHNWRLVIKDYETVRRAGAGYEPCVVKVTDYEFQGRLGWRSGKHWPEYNFNDGTYSGLPRTLVKLYEREREATDWIIYGRVPAQRGLAL
jgi:hypothetical protein